jgi:hypothetical protein
MINVAGYSTMFEILCQQIITTANRSANKTLIIKSIDNKSFSTEWVSSF